jgi:hypothetical protein
MPDSLSGVLTCKAEMALVVREKHVQLSPIVHPYTIHLRAIMQHTRHACGPRVPLPRTSLQLYDNPNILKPPTSSANPNIDDWRCTGSVIMARAVAAKVAFTEVEVKVAFRTWTYSSKVKLPTSYCTCKFGR